MKKINKTKKEKLFFSKVFEDFDVKSYNGVINKIRSSLNDKQMLQLALDFHTKFDFHYEKKNFYFFYNFNKNNEKDISNLRLKQNTINITLVDNKIKHLFYWIYRKETNIQVSCEFEKITMSYDDMVLSIAKIIAEKLKKDNTLIIESYIVNMFNDYPEIKENLQKLTPDLMEVKDWGLVL